LFILLYSVRIEYMDKDKKTLVIIDGNAIVHRAYHALPPLRTKKGELVNAVYGFLLALFKAIKDFEPDYIVATFDLPGKTFRHQKYKLYKANRVKAPDELYAQIPKIKEVLNGFGIKIFEKKGFEADDLIGTIAKTIPKKQIYPPMEVIILTGDMDVLQLVDKNIKVSALRKGIKDTVIYDEEAVKEKYDGLTPEQLIDYKGLRGDPSDNIPGVIGIGEKTAIALIKEFGSMDNIYEGISKNTRGIKEKIKEKLVNQKDQALVSRMLGKINDEVPLDFNLGKCAWKGYNKDKVNKILEDYGFKSLVKRLFEPVKVERKTQNLL